MKVFLSWSGDHSRQLAMAMRDWLPRVLQSVQPWLSSSDITAGSRWVSEIALQLQESRFGILCLTPDNLESPWLLFEAGALSKGLESVLICPYLLGISPTELTGPLIQFQATTADKDGTRQLVRALNRALGEQSISENLLDESFEVWWSRLNKVLSGITMSQAPTPPRKEHIPIAPTADELLKLIQVEQRGRGRGAEGKQRVFLIHGHNLTVRESVARFVEKLGPSVIILDEQPSSGRTVIEKFESYAGVDFAVALMTADDVGVGEPPLKRARQNVVFELGFFTAKLGRSRLAVLYEEGVEMPSDFSGIVYIQVDKAGAWRFQLAQELKTAGLRIDLNKAI